MNLLPMSELLNSIVTFLNRIGISTTAGQVSSESFLPGIRVTQGTLVFDPDTLRWPGDLLHEAGHIATTPSSLRVLLNDALDDQFTVPHAGEAEATAWAYAASVYLQLDPSVLFHSEGYRGHSSGLIRSYTLGVYPGVFGLVQAGMAITGPEASITGVAPYPHMQRWLRQ